MNTIKYEITTFNLCFEPNLMPGKNWLKNFSVTSSALSLIMVSLLTLQEIKLIAISNWILNVSDFLRLFMIFFKYGLILLKYSLTDSVLFLALLLL